MKWLVTVLAVGTLLFSSVAQAQISGTDHDLSGNGWGSDQLCIFCHTPHKADTTVSGAPLWNHENTVATFAIYASDTLDAVPGQPSGASKLCLSCHDGTVAIDSFGGATGTHTMTGDAMVGTNLADDHPISFTYDASLASDDGELTTPESADWVDAGHELPLYGAQMQCASCHDVHDDTNGAFLRLSNAASALCLKCHQK